MIVCGVSLGNAVIGLCLVAFIFYVIIPLWKILLTHFLGIKLFSKRKELLCYGKWAVVTGATDGIGLAYCEQLAKLGLNIVLISRTQTKLDNVAEKIHRDFGVETKTIAVDFTRNDIYTVIENGLVDADVGTLVNNVGMLFDIPDDFESKSTNGDSLVNIMNCNMLSAVRMTKLLLPRMITKAKGGAIINVSSFAGTFPVPLMAMYSATKVFFDYFSRAVNYEVKHHSITVQSVLPLYVSTKMSQVPPSLIAPTPEDYVCSALQLFGVEDRTCGCLSHSLQTFIFDLLPIYLKSSIFYFILRIVRQRSLKKLEKLK